METVEPRKNRIISDQEAENVTRTEELAYEIKVEEVMTRSIKSVKPDDTMQAILDLFRNMHISGLPVMQEDGSLVGVISIEDLMRALVASDLDAPVKKYMTSRVITIHSTDPLVEALKFFVNTKLGRLPVMNAEGKMVGILTKGDITRGLLRALQHDKQEEEMRRYRASHLFEDIESDRTSLILRYNIKARDFTHGGSASSNIKRALARLGASPQIARRCGIAIYEAEINLIIHTTEGGVLRVEIEPHQISIDAYDYGPGIKDVQLAMKAGYSTASDEVREMGFGAGMGLVNIQRCTDYMNLESVYGKGSRLKMKIFLNKEEAMGDNQPQPPRSLMNEH